MRREEARGNGMLFWGGTASVWRKGILNEGSPAEFSPRMGLPKKDPSAPTADIASSESISKCCALRYLTSLISPKAAPH